MPWYALERVPSDPRPGDTVFYICRATTETKEAAQALGGTGLGRFVVEASSLQAAIRRLGEGGSGPLPVDRG